MNFLYQAAIFMAHRGANCYDLKHDDTSALNNTTLDLQVSKHYSNTMKKIAKKNVLRLHSNIKRTVCKKCGMVFIPGKTCTVREVENENNKQLYTEYKCNSCQFSKRYLIPKLSNR
ncbi:hypothetical protein C9374_012541 [Naegleria lovaniensis]|uniref:Uncharacterized protein n=1 Tax=Naegleria lovaniensis TaxID=51637 RepID=A0AA88KR13_NAELO|nr:uncharacterized protein C9374_012541 [Naegleria lovaniensis]KAG2392289.1 hypothetical protein C9374_012541 [Naegleria lovaniensis]